VTDVTVIAMGFGFPMVTRSVDTPIDERMLVGVNCFAIVGGSGCTVRLATLEAVPVADPTRRRRHRELLTGEIPSPIRAVGDEPVVAPLVEVAPGHFVAEHRIAGVY